MNRRVLVTDGEHRSALAITRSLGRAGCAVFNCATRPPSLAAASRWNRGEAGVPDALEQPEAFAEKVATLVRRWEIDTVVPATDESLLAANYQGIVTDSLFVEGQYSARRLSLEFLEPTRECFSQSKPQKHPVSKPASAPFPVKATGRAPALPS